MASDARTAVVAAAAVGWKGMVAGTRKVQLQTAAGNSSVMVGVDRQLRDSG